jgi:Patatin-like phospholipase
VRKADDKPARRPTVDSEVVGLALSGGGIRSAAVCLGALQALDQAGVLPKVDYLSTVSGGGYIGSSLSAGMSASNGQFPFPSKLAEDEPPAMQHLRDYSNYLFPRGHPGAFLHNVAIYARGLVANQILVAVFLFIFAGVTILSNHNREGLSKPNFFGQRVYNIFGYDHFVITSYLALALLFIVILWGVYRSIRPNGAEVHNWLPTSVGWVVIAVLISGFFELQPFILEQMFEAQGTKSGFSGALYKLINQWAVALAPIAGAAAFLARKIGEFVKSGMESSRTRDQIAAYASKALIYLAALLLPLLLWAIYLQLSYWGLCLGTAECAAAAGPQWAAFAGKLSHNFGDIGIGYLVVAFVLFVITLFLRPNANSLHPLYRDRLSDAFLFDPGKFLPSGVLAPLQLKLSGLSEEHAPYHLINAALNVQSSKAANRRGRNADFFLFSRNFVGSKTTEYVRTADMEKVMPGLDLGTAMAVSGAAASSQMGAETIKPLGPTIAILNIRLGYWLRNPIKVKHQGGFNRLANYYFLAEMFGLLNEHRKSIYLTDGGHIENLGIYQLLKRRCRVIIVVDAEADQQMGFGSFNTLERYARIDLGVRIDLPWQAISDMTKKTGESIDKTGDAPKNAGPHCAIGQIKYPGDRTGVLVYIKASLTGDENDYIFQYKKRYSAFPHETTLDQMFSEEQFEVYRALGYHAASNLFDGWDQFAHLDPGKPGVADDLALLDRLFPRAAAEPGSKSFAERL